MARLRFGALFAIRVIAESGLLYTLSSIAVLCAIFSEYAHGPQAHYLDVIPIITAIVRFT